MSNDDSADVIGLTLGFIVFFLDLIVFCIFVSRVRISFNKQIIDDEWQTANDYWLKLSRVSGLMFSIFHIGTMSIVIAECTNIHNTLLHDNEIAHIYWLLESLWTFNVNSAIVLITMRCYRVYKTTKTKFTPLKDWIASNQLSIEYFIWSIYILITLFIIIQYLIIISSAPDQYFDIELSLINALRNFATATILSFQLIIACFFFYIAHKSQQQTNWNEQSKAIIYKETAKLAFIVIFLALIIGIILYRAIWYLVHLHTHTYALNAPFHDINHRVFWSILEFLAFWLILYLTRLRTPPSDHDAALPSSTNTKSFLPRALSTKNRKEALKQMKLKELEERKKAFREREKRKQYHKPMRTADNTFNTLFIKQVAKYEREKQAHQKRLDQKKLLIEIKQKKQQKRQQHRKMKQIHKELKERNSNTYHKPMHRYNQTDPGAMHDILEAHGGVMSLNILEEVEDHKMADIDTNEAAEANAMSDDSPLEPIPEPQPDFATALTMIDIDSSGMSDSEAPIPSGGNILDELPKISVTPRLYTSASGYALTPRNEMKSKPVDVVLTPHHASENADDEPRISLQPIQWSLKPSVSISDVTTETDTGMDTDIATEEEEEADDIEDDEAEEEVELALWPENDAKPNYSKARSIIAKLGSVFTPKAHVGAHDEKQFTMFPSVRVVTEKEASAEDVEPNTERLHQWKKPRAQTDPLNPGHSNGTMLFQITDDKEDLPIIRSHPRDSPLVEQEGKHNEQIQEIVDIYLDAFKTKQKSNDDMEMEMDPEDAECKEYRQPHIDKASAVNALNAPMHSAHDNKPKTPQPPPINTKRNTQVIGDGIFHNMVHLKPMLLKRSHSDPDIRSRNEIWDQLLSAFQEMNEGLLPTSPEMMEDRNLQPDNFLSQRDSPIESSTQQSSHHNEDYHFFMHRNVSIKEEDHELEMSNQTQLSTARDSGFHLFGFFDYNNTDGGHNGNKRIPKLNTLGSDPVPERKRKRKKEKHKHKIPARDSLQLPVSHSPVRDELHGTKSLNQPLSVRLSLHDEKRKRQSSGKSDRKQSNKSDGKRSKNKSDRKQSKADKNQKKRNSRSHKRTSLMTADITKKAKHDTQPKSKRRRSKIKKKKIFKLRMKQKQQTKQWMDNVHQVF